MELNEEKKEIDGSVLVTANPGTGNTILEEVDRYIGSKMS